MPPRRRPRLDSNVSTPNQPSKLGTAISPSGTASSIATSKATLALAVPEPNSKSTTPKQTATEEPKKIASKDPWTNEQETLLLEAVIQCKPTGLHKHFRMIAIAQYLQNHGISLVSAPHTRIPGIWLKLRSLYDLEILDERELQHFWSEYADEVATAAEINDEADAADEEEEEDILPTKSRTSTGKTKRVVSPEERAKDSAEPEAELTPITYFSLPGDEFEELTWQRRIRRDNETYHTFLPSSSPGIPDLYSLRPTAEWIAKRKAQNRAATPEPTASSRPSSSSSSPLSSPAPPSASARTRRRNVRTKRNQVPVTPTTTAAKPGRRKSTAAVPAAPPAEEEEVVESIAVESSSPDDEEEEKPAPASTRGRKAKRGRGGATGTGPGRRKRR